jgi:hypothetical protein
MALPMPVCFVKIAGSTRSMFHQLAYRAPRRVLLSPTSGVWAVGAEHTLVIAIWEWPVTWAATEMLPRRTAAKKQASVL